MAEQVGTEKDKVQDQVDDLNKVVEDNTEGTKPVEKSAMEIELDKLRVDNADQQARINQYDGERSQMSETMNELKQQVNGLVKKQEEPADNTDPEDLVTKGELAEYKKGEAGRLQAHEDKKDAKDKAYSDEYTKGLGRASMPIKNNETYKAILSEVIALENSGNMPQSTGNAELDGQIAWDKAENVYLKKKNAAGEQIPFTSTATDKATGVGSTDLNNPVKTETKAMPALGSAEQQLLEDLGEAGNADFVNKALAKT